jgi:AcrR family transcriptional regulator
VKHVPAIAKTTDEEVVAVTRRLIKRHGADAVSMLSVAQAIGVRAPSLYKRFADRQGLLSAVEQQVLTELGKKMLTASRAPTPTEQLNAMALAYRRFARAHPRLYALLYSGATLGDAAGTTARAQAIKPMLDAFEALVGAERALPSARVFTAFLHGFVSMENAHEFRMGPGVDDAFNLGLQAVIPAATP